MLAVHILSCSCLSKVCSLVSEAIAFYFVLVSVKFARVFQRLSCLLCIFYPALVSVKFARVFHRLSCLLCIFYPAPVSVKFARVYQRLSCLL